MKFLCIACDESMRLTDTAGPDEGSLRVSFACPACGHRIAMLTNPWETQMVRTLGVKVGGAPAGEPVPYAAVRAGLTHQRDAALVAEVPVMGSGAPAPAGSAEGPGCPFAAMMGAAVPVGTDVSWTTEAEGRLERIPVFIRPMAKQAIERFARERGHGAVTAQVMDEAREFMGM